MSDAPENIPEKPLPYPDRDSEPYWRALAGGALELQRCSGCGCLRWPPRGLCNRCHEFSSEWTAVSGRGHVVSWTRTHQVFARPYRDEVPYYTVQIALEEQDDILMIGGWRSEREPRAGEPVVVILERINDEVVLPQWAPERN